MNQQLHQRVIEGLQAYRRDGNQALGVYVDKENPTDVPQQFEYMLSYAKALPKYLPDFRRYLSHPIAGLRKTTAELRESARSFIKQDEGHAARPDRPSCAPSPFFLAA